MSNMNMFATCCRILYIAKSLGIQMFHAKDISGTCNNNGVFIKTNTSFTAHSLLHCAVVCYNSKRCENFGYGLHGDLNARDCVMLFAAHNKTNSTAPLMLRRLYSLDYHHMHSHKCLHGIIAHVQNTTSGTQYFRTERAVLSTGKTFSSKSKTNWMTTRPANTESTTKIKYISILSASTSTANTVSVTADITSSEEILSSPTGTTSSATTTMSTETKTSSSSATTSSMKETSPVTTKTTVSTTAGPMSVMSKTKFASTTMYTTTEATSSTTVHPTSSKTCTCNLPEVPSGRNQHIYVIKRVSKPSDKYVHVYDFGKNRFINLGLKLDGNTIRLSPDSLNCKMYFIRRMSSRVSYLNSICFDGSRQENIKTGPLYGLHLDAKEGVLFFGIKVRKNMEIHLIKTNGKRERKLYTIDMSNTKRFEWKYLAGDAKKKIVLWAVTTTNIHPHHYIVSVKYDTKGSKNTKEISLADTSGCLVSDTSYLVIGDYIKLYEVATFKKVKKLSKCPFDSFPMDPVGCAIEDLLYLVCQRRRHAAPVMFLFTSHKKLKAKVTLPIKAEVLVNVG